MTREEVIEKAEHDVFANNNAHLESIADFAIQLRDEALAAKDAEIAATIDEVERSGPLGLGGWNHRLGFVEALDAIRKRLQGGKG